MMVKCRFCGTKIKREAACKVISGGKNIYYCGQECADKGKAETEKRLLVKAEQDKLYDKISEVIGQDYSFPVVRGELSAYFNLGGLRKMNAYLEDNQSWIGKSMGEKVFRNGYVKIKYFCAILKNNLPAYVFPDSCIPQKTAMADTVLAEKCGKRQKRRSMEELEDMV